MPISKQEQEPHISRLYDVLVNAVQNYSTKEHPDRDLPQICEVTTSNSPSLDLFKQETSISTGQLLDLMSDFDNDPENDFARLWVNDADVTKRIQYLRNVNPELVAWQIAQEGEDLYQQGIKGELQTRSILIALENWFEGYEPNPTDKHYLLCKEYRRIISLAIEEIRDENCADQLVCENNEDAVAFNTKALEKCESLKAADKKAYTGLQSRLLLAEITYHRQTGAAAMMRTSHRTPHRAKRASAGHGAASKAGDDGDGGGDGEPPRPPQSPLPPPHLRPSLAHSLISGGVQW